MSRRERLAELNDAFRSRLGVPDFGAVIPGKFVWTQGINALPPEAQIDIWDRVRRFSDFTEDNDPYGEHDFGAFDHPQAGKVFWKIDYYDPVYECGSEDSCDLSLTARVLTILLAEEW